ncbi:probable E3 ubiquitin-protein ligase RHB1A [Rhodamnia argentea]|uniref:RING-type E3 ubiquitin transferase n=1 Tax=Rhodamnia argentea TaxID=178133 RepID=A0A8B8PV13_9MYRT|nr:probable E3 ubiquitin-protein ligase RHB1A [Rhodamnia argentea]XP_048132250.1 probable E3 ubiquitin-protein ligase RHB1A [Rhodamnia argentea]
MGGCCCCPRPEPPPFYHGPTASEQLVPLSSHHNSASTISSGLVVDTNLETTSIDTYTPPPAPLPYDVASGHPQTPLWPQESTGIKTNASVETPDSVPAENVGGNVLDKPTKCGDLKLSDCKGQDYVLETENEPEIELSESVNLVISSAEECPTCLEEYDANNPKIVTKCEHHFHLACILEWMERSDTCPVCDEEMIFNYPVN